MAIQTLDVVRVDNAFVLLAKAAEKKNDKAQDKVEIHFCARKWLPKQGEILSVEFAKTLKVILKVKIEPSIFKTLKGLGLKPGSVCDLELASSGWASDRDQGNWYQYLGLFRLDGRDVNHFIYKQNDASSVLNGFDSEWVDNSQEVVEEI